MPDMCHWRNPSNRKTREKGERERARRTGVGEGSEEERGNGGGMEDETN